MNFSKYNVRFIDIIHFDAIPLSRLPNTYGIYNETAIPHICAIDQTTTIMRVNYLVSSTFGAQSMNS